ncbi:MAG: CBS domain-containing protein [bacterium]
MDDPNVSDLMTRHVATVREDLPIKELIRMVKERRYSGFPVVDGQGAAVAGIITATDLVRHFARVMKG